MADPALGNPSGRPLRCPNDILYVNRDSGIPSAMNRASLTALQMNLVFTLGFPDDQWEIPYGTCGTDTGADDHDLEVEGERLKFSQIG